jgi:signal transduction histidine kinase
MTVNLSLRTKFLLVVLCGALLPLGLIGLWLMRSVEQSGEELLRARMDASMQGLVQEVGTQWVRLRSELLDLAEDEQVQRALRAERAPDAGTLRVLQESHAAPGSPLRLAAFRPLGGAESWTLTQPVRPRTVEVARSGPASEQPTVGVTLPVVENRSGTPLGSLEAAVEIGALVPVERLRAVTFGSVLAVFDRASGTPVLPLPFEPSLLAMERFHWGGEEWLTLRRRLESPPLELVLAAPLTPYSQPFVQAARQGAIALLLVALLGFVVISLLTRRITGSLERLALAADAVSRGELEQRVEENGTGETARVAHAFNAMTAHLRQTLQELAQRQGLAALGEFAATLAHEIRNPLTTIRIDLQRVQEKLPKDSPTRGPVVRALRQIERLNGTVSNVLRLARSGQITAAPLDLRVPLEAALHVARPQFERYGVALDIEPGDLPHLPVRGDPGALEQLFLNLLLNAQQAVEAGGRVSVSVRAEGAQAEVRIRDDGRGIAPDALARIFEPFYTTRADGTGLGLPIARRTAVAHGGRLELDSAPGAGTTARVRLPLLGASVAGHRWPGV